MSKPATCTPFLRPCRVACEPEKDTPPKKAAVIFYDAKRNAKVTVETVETVAAAEPYAALIGHKLRPLLHVGQPISARWL